MSDEVKAEIQTILELLKGVIVKDGVSMGLADDKIIFFDTETYVRENKFNGFAVSIDELVRSEEDE